MEVLFWETNSDFGIEILCVFICGSSVLGGKYSDFVQCIQLFSAIHSDFVAHNSSRSGLSAFSKFKIK